MIEERISQERRIVDFTVATINFLNILSKIFGSYGMGIIALTIIIRTAMWPLSATQQRSMKDMQRLQPKMKVIQDRYKNDPQTMQRKMMEFYKEHNFNPMAGCLPMLIQLPIFILLYSSLMSPQFISMAGNSKFLFIDRLDETLKGNAGISYDGTFNVTKHDLFMLNKNIKVFIGDEELDDVKINNIRKALKVQGDIVPNQPIDFKISLDELDLKFSQLEKVTKAEVVITNTSTRELERIMFKSTDNILTASVPTTAAKASFHYDVLFLIILFGTSMFLSTKIMTAANQSVQTDPAQAAMQKTMGTMMPVMLVATFLFIPIPAGVLLYLTASNIFQVTQTLIINKQIDAEYEKKKLGKSTATDVDADNADLSKSKKVKAKEVKNVESEEGDEEDTEE